MQLRPHQDNSGEAADDGGRLTDLGNREWSAETLRGTVRQ
jgi:hypothetical protein